MDEPNITSSYVITGNTSRKGNMTYPGFDMPFPPNQYTWAWWLLQVATPIICVVGITGNVLSFLVMKTRRLRNKSYAHYLCTLAVFDSLVLVGRFVRRLDSLLHRYGHTGVFESYDDAACKIHNFCEHVCFLMSSWLVLCVTVERFIAVNFPFKKERLCRPRNAVTVILGVFVFMSYSQIFRLIVYEKDSKARECVVPKDYIHIYLAMHIYLYQLLLQFSIPALLVIICNTLILLKIAKLRKGVKEHGMSHNTNAANGRSKTTCMLLGISFIYVVTLLPLVLISIMIHVASIYNKPLAVYLLINLKSTGDFFEFVSEFNYASNFFVYVVSGTHFRYELRNICCFGYQSVQTIHTRSSTSKVFRFRRNNSSASSLKSMEGTKRTQSTEPQISTALNSAAATDGTRIQLIV